MFWGVSQDPSFLNKILDSAWLEYCNDILPCVSRIHMIHYFLDSTAGTHKAHLLSHVVSCVWGWGPLLAYSSFHFEAMNQVIS